jgi:ketosteroid isomerase-like protein
MRSILLSAILVVCAATPTPAQTEKQTSSGNAEQTVLQTTNDWLAAEERHDRAALERIIADDFVGTGPTGTTVTKRMIVPAESTRRAGGMRMKTQDVQARVYGDAAVVTGRGLPTGPEGGEVRFTLVFVKRQERWQMVAAHIAPLPAQP